MGGVIVDADDARRRDPTSQQASARAHEDAAERLYASGDDTLADHERDLGRADREDAGIDAERRQLRRERDRSRSADDAVEPGEPGTAPDAVDPADAER